MLLLAGEGENADGPGQDVEGGVEHGGVNCCFRRVREKGADHRHAEEPHIAHDSRNGKHPLAELLPSLFTQQKQDQEHERRFPDQGEEQEKSHLRKKLRRGIQVGQGVHIQTESADVQQDDADAAQVIRFDFFDLAHEKTGQQVQEHQQHVAERYGETDHGHSPHIKHYNIGIFVRTERKP